MSNQEDLCITLPAGEERYTFTIFIPAYNRAHCLPRAFASIAGQTFRDFEVLIIDDGSTDGTCEIVGQWAASMPFPVIYHWQENQGKHIAHNTAVKYARGMFTVLLDSDDQLKPNALERIKYHWDHLDEARRPLFAGIEGLCVDQEGRLSGNRFPADNMESTYLETRNFLGIGGEKKNAILTSVLRKYPYPQFAGEKHIRDSLLWERISEDYLFLYVNEVFQVFEYQPGGLSANIFRLRVSNPQGFRFYYLEDINRRAGFHTRRQLLDSYARYIRYSLHAGVGLLRQFKEVSSGWRWLLMLPKGAVKWLSDRWRLARINTTRQAAGA